MAEDGATKYVATLRMKVNPRAYEMVVRDMLVVDELGNIHIVKAGTPIPVYDDPTLTIENDK